MRRGDRAAGARIEPLERLTLSQLGSRGAGKADSWRGASVPHQGRSCWGALAAFEGALREQKLPGYMDSLIDVYDAWEKPEEAQRWRDRRDAISPRDT